VETLPPRVLWLSVLVFLFTGAAAASAQPPPPPPPPQEPAQVLEPIAAVSAEDVKELLLSGVGVAAEMARVGGGVSGVFLVTSDGLLVAGDAAEAAVMSANKVLENHLLVISHNQALLEELQSRDRLRRGDPGFDAAMAALKRESAALSVGATGGFMEAVLSRQGFLVMGRTALLHYLTSYFGERLGRAIGDRLGLGGWLRSLAVERLARDRTITRPTWKRADRIARTMARLIDELIQFGVEETVDVAVDSAVGDGGGGGAGTFCLPATPTLMPGAFGPTVISTPGPCFPLGQRSGAASPRAAAVRPGDILIRAAPAVIAKPIVPQRPPPPMLMPSVVRGLDPAPSTPGTREASRAGIPEAPVMVPSHGHVDEGPAYRQAVRIDLTNWPDP